MDLNLIFKIAGIGIVVAILNILLNKSGREEQGTMIIIAGLIAVMLILAGEISELFSVLEKLFKK
ncbi:MAG: stage III sporulation protein AC [Ruminococcaceae bacterium]|nr:stage III sporulation protein AC [Oscillospiraceae bacterium]